jgi:hypothetical protein
MKGVTLFGGTRAVSDDNPFCVKPAGLFASLIGDGPDEAPANPFGKGLGLLALVHESSGVAVANPLFGSIGMLENPPPSPAFGGLFGLAPLANQPTLFGALYAPAPAPYAPPKPVAPAIKRRAFFSFHWTDVWRVNVIRKAWKFRHPDNALLPSFVDSSLWESKKLNDDEAIKRLIQDGVRYTSAVCVLAGADTWERRWVRYEIARAIIDGRGLLTVHLNSIRHHATQTLHTRGHNPLSFMAIGKVQDNALRPARYFLFEKRLVWDGVGGWKLGWCRYDDYKIAVELPAWVRDPQPGYVTPLSDCAPERDYIAHDGHKNIGGWIDLAAQRAGR